MHSTDPSPSPGSLAARAAEMTLHQLRIFCSVAQAKTLTRASKQLGLTQPSLSQQVSKLEGTVGARLFERTAQEMRLTDAGQFLLRKAEQILMGVDEAQAGLQSFAAGQRGMVRVAGLSSLLRTLLPDAMADLDTRMPGVEFDIHEGAPTEILELLYARRAVVGLLAANALPSDLVGFERTPLLDDPYVFAVPERIAIAGVSDPDADLAAADNAVLNSSIQFNFGSLHTREVDRWFQHVLPRHRLAAQCRSYEVALSLVQRGLGVCLLPAAAVLGAGAVDGVALYRVSQPSRRLVSLMPTQYRSIEPYRSFNAALAAAARRMVLPALREPPPFLDRRSADAAGEAQP